MPYCEKHEGYSGLLGAKPYAGGGCILGVAGSVEEIFGLLKSSFGPGFPEMTRCKLGLLAGNHSVFKIRVMLFSITGGEIAVEVLLGRHVTEVFLLEFLA